MITSAPGRPLPFPSVMRKRTDWLPAFATASPPLEVSAHAYEVTVRQLAGEPDVSVVARCVQERFRTERIVEPPVLASSV